MRTLPRAPVPPTRWEDGARHWSTEFEIHLPETRMSKRSATYRSVLGEASRCGEGWCSMTPRFGG